MTRARRSDPLFAWAVATSSYQIEGATEADGRGAGIWDDFASRPGSIRGGDNAAIACDHYHRMAEDVALLGKLGVDAYRFSVSWPRLLPEGIGQPNSAGIDFYDRLLDRLLEQGIRPWLTLYHWDLPHALQREGGWANRDAARWLCELAALVDRSFGDRIDKLIVLNEACMTSHRGHGFGTDAPGIRDRQAMLAAIHHQNLAQGNVLAQLRAAGSGYDLGTAVLIQPAIAFTDHPADRAAAARLDATWNGACLDPLLTGRYPSLIEDEIAFLVEPGDMERIHQPTDFIGVNYYVRMFVRASDGPVGVERVKSAGADWRSPFGMECFPQGLGNVLRLMRDRYGNPPVIVTECGYADIDDMPLDRLLDDADRIAYLQALIIEIEKAAADGSDVRGVTFWSLLDNFEWEFGFWPRFGLVHVDYATQHRTPKKSFRWLASRIDEARATRRKR